MKNTNLITNFQLAERFCEKEGLSSEYVKKELLLRLLELQARQGDKALIFFDVEQGDKKYCIETNLIKSKKWRIITMEKQEYFPKTVFVITKDLEVKAADLVRAFPGENETLVNIDGVKDFHLNRDVFKTEPEAVKKRNEIVTNRLAEIDKEKGALTNLIK